MKTIYLNSTVYEICTQYPEAISIMEQLGFEEISKPGMLNTTGRFVTLKTGASIRKVDPEKIKKVFSEHGFTVNEQAEKKDIKQIKEDRKKALKDIIGKLHAGQSVDDVKEQFDKEFGNVSALEISQAEQALISEGVTVEEIQKLCDVHAAVFKGSIEQIHSDYDETDNPGHPIYVLKKENAIIQDIINSKIRYFLKAAKPEIHTVLSGLKQLLYLDIHYSKKENLLFPYMEKYGIPAPPKVMWGVDDEIKRELKKVISDFENNRDLDRQFKSEIERLLVKAEEMIYKEENIMVPMLIEKLARKDWITIAKESPEIGFLYDDVPVWPIDNSESSAHKSYDGADTDIVLPSGAFTVDELTSLLNTLPFDITFVDKNDKVRYFSQSEERIFARTKAIIGREVSNCHPPASVHIVEKIVDDFKTGKKNEQSFWIKMGEKLVYIRYFAVRNEKGEYLGVAEVSQDIAPIQLIEGEKRLMSE